MKIYYVNHNNEKINFMEENYNIEESSLFSHLWEYETQTLTSCGEKITKFDKKTNEIPLIVHVETQGLVSCEQAYNQMMEIFELDVLKMKPGKLYVGEYYISCYIIENEPKYFVPGIGSISCELNIIAPYSFWINEQQISISPISGAAATEDTSLKTYPYTYPYTYPLLQTQVAVNIDHYTDSDFQMKVYGPTDSVHITIAGHPYIVEYPLDEGEYMVIDSRPYVAKDKRLYVVKKDGKIVNVFHYRDTDNSVFKKIPSGPIVIDYPRTYGVDLTLFKERSEPLWS